MTMTLSGTGGAALTTPGYCYLPNGLILQWGTTGVSSGATTITFPIAFPNSCLGVTCTSYDTTNAAWSFIKSWTSSSFVWWPGNANSNGSYMAVGY